MKKSLIALAVAGVVAAPAAMADVTIYGAANVSYDQINNGLVASGSSSSHISSNVSKLGFKGSEDLGDGLSAIWQIEQSIALDSNQTNAGAAAAQTLANRNTFAGLSSTSMGTLVIGQHDTPYKLSTRAYDQFADTVADNRSMMGGTGGSGGVHDARLGNVIAYISPAMSGFTIAAATVTGAEAYTNGNTKGGAYSLAAMYSQDNITAAFAYQAIDVGTAGSGTMGAGAVPGAVNDKATAWKLGGSYAMDAFSVNGVYESTDFKSGGVSTKQSNLYLSGKFNVSASDAVKLAYTSAGKVGSAINTDATQISLGYDHSLSKRTSVYALYTKVSNKTAATYGFGTQATSAGFVGATADQDPSAFSIDRKSVV